MTAAEQLPDKLRVVLGTALDLETADITIDNLRPLKRGLKRATWAFDVVTRYGRRALILQTERTKFAAMELQARAQAAAAARAVPVARIVAVDDSAEALGEPYLISEMVKGEIDYVHIVRQLDSVDGQAGRAQLLRQCALALAGIHRVDTTDPERDRLDRFGQCRRALDAAGEASASFEWAFRWLATHRPPPSSAVLVHGDYRMGNFLVDGSDLTAVIDWESVHVGEAYEDLAWFCLRAWRFGAPASLGAGGLGSIEDFLCAYEGASETGVDRTSFHWWLVMSTLFWGMLCRDKALRWLTGKIPSMHLAILGRRVCEIEWDLLNLLDQTQPGNDAGRGRPEEKPGNQTQPGDDAGPVGAQAEGVTRLGEHAGQADPAVIASVYGRPSVAELIAAIATHLETTIGPAASGNRKTQAEVRAAADALRTVERELLAGSADDVLQALASLGFTDEAQLAAAIRNGDLDHRAHDVTSYLRALVNHRLAVAHPGYQNE